MKAFAGILLATILVPVSFLHSDEIQSYNKALKKELGIVDESKESPKPEPVQESESNPVRDRYTPPQEEGSLFFLLLRILFIFGILTLFMLYILRVMAKSKIAKYPIQGKMSILSSLPIGTNKQVQMVEVSNRILILGVGESTVSLLGEITDEEEKARLLREKQEYMPSQENFLNALLDGFRIWKPITHPEPKSMERNGEYLKSIQDLEELERKQQEAIRRLQAYRKDLGMDLGGSI